MPELSDLFLGQLSEMQAACVIDTGSLGARRTMLVNERLRKTEKEDVKEAAGGGGLRLYAEPAGLMIWNLKPFSLLPPQHKQTQS